MPILPYHQPDRGAKTMPMTRISLRRGRPAEERRRIMEQIYQAQRETFDVPEDDRFMVLSEHAPDDLVYGAGYLGIRRSDDLVLIQMTVSNSRPLAKKQALFRRIAERLAEDPGVRPEDVFINLVEVAKENWSFGNGEAQYAEAG
jgi:4-oxalocrotonate tautomerase